MAKQQLATAEKFVWDAGFFGLFEDGDREEKKFHLQGQHDQLDHGHGTGEVSKGAGLREEATALQDRIRTAGGFSFNPVSDRFQSIGQNGFAVAVKQGPIFQGHVTKAQIRKFMQDNKELLGRRGYYVGGWRDPADGKIYLDISIITRSKERAFSIAEKRGELAVFDFKEGVALGTNTRSVRAHERRDGGGAGRLRGDLERGEEELSFAEPRRPGEPGEVPDDDELEDEEDEDEEGRRSSRALIRFEITNPVVMTWIRLNVGDLVRQITNEQMLAIRNVLESSFVNGVSPFETARTIRSMIGLTTAQTGYVNRFQNQLTARGLPQNTIDRLVARYRQNWIRNRARVIARTETIRAAVSGQQQFWSQMVAKDILSPVEMEQVFLITPDDRLCPKCRPYQNLRAPIGGTFDGGITGPPIHPQCLPRETNITAIGGTVAGATGRWYEGDMIVIHTTGNKRLSCTPNHPILTRRGWIAAELLEVGEHVICVDNVVENHDYQYMPTVIEEIFEAFGRISTGAKVPVAVEDFHGDGMGSDVAVVYAGRLLGYDLDTMIEKQVDEYLFHWPNLRSTLHGQSMVNLGFGSAWHTTNRSVSGRGVLPSLFRCAACGEDTVSFDSSSSGNVVFFQDPSNRVSVSLVDPGERSFPLPSSVLFNNSRFWKTKREPSLFDVSFSSNNSFSLGGADIIGTVSNSSFGSSNGFGSTSTDTIKSLRRERFSGHVYNLETEQGWYAAEGIVTHNCRCAVALARIDSKEGVQRVYPPPYAPRKKGLKPKVPKGFTEDVGGVALARLRMVELEARGITRGTLYQDLKTFVEESRQFHLQGQHDQKSHGGEGGGGGAGSGDSDGQARLGATRAPTIGEMIEGAEQPLTKWILAETGVVTAGALGVTLTERQAMKAKIAAHLVGALEREAAKNPKLRKQLADRLGKPEQLSGEQKAELVAFGVAKYDEFPEAIPARYRSDPEIVDRLRRLDAYLANPDNAEKVAVRVTTQELIRTRILDLMTLGNAHQPVMQESLRKYASDFIHTWAESSADFHPRSLATQEIVSEMFDIPLPKHLTTGRNTQKENIAKVRREEGEIFKTLLQEQYDYTQHELKAAGIDAVTLYRGSELNPSRDRPEFSDSVTLQPLSSFSVYFPVAYQFSGQDSITAMRVPRERILSTARMGFGALHEGEVTVLGGSDLPSITLHSTEARDDVRRRGVPYELDVFKARVKERERGN